MDKPEKDFWSKLEIVLSPVGALCATLAVAILGFYGSRFLSEKQESDTRARVYAELTSQREQAETVLRKDMFSSIFESFLKPEKSSPDLKVLNMELLAYNFHESLDLKPLFSYVQRQLAAIESPSSAKPFKDRLEKVASDVTRKQLLTLEEAGQKFDRTIDLDKLRVTPTGIIVDSATCKLAGIERTFRLVLLKADPDRHELQVRLEITTQQPFPETKRVEFSVGFYDFPMIDNTRLSQDQRCAVVLNTFEEHRAEITLVCFPGSRASLKEKTFSEDVIRNLQSMPMSGQTKR